ncbi:hypothetical protein D3C79_911250 [compost metagenome]
MPPLITNALVHELAGNEAGFIRQNAVQATGSLLIADKHGRSLAQQAANLVIGKLDGHRQQNPADLLDSQQGIDPLVAGAHGNAEHLALAAANSPLKGTSQAHHVTTQLVQCIRTTVHFLDHHAVRVCRQVVLHLLADHWPIPPMR